MANEVVQDSFLQAPEAYADILKAYCAYDDELRDLPDSEREKIEPNSLFYYAWHGHFYAGKFKDDKAFLPFIRLVNHLALIDPDYVKILRYKTQDILKAESLDADALMEQVNQVFNRIERDAVEERKTLAAHYLEGLLEPTQRNYSVNIEKSTFETEYKEAINTTDNNFFEEWITRLTENGNNLKLAYDVRKIRDGLLEKKRAVDAELEKLKNDIESAKAELGISSKVESSANLQVANAAATLVGVGEGMVAAKGIADLGIGIPLAASFAAVGSSGFFSNFYLTRDDTKATLDILGSQGEASTDSTRSRFRKMLDWVNDRKLFFDDNTKKQISGGKKGFALIALISSVVVGGLFGYLSFISGWGMLTGMILGSAALPALPVLAGIGLVSVAAFFMANRLQGWKRGLALGALVALTAGLGYFALPYVAGVIAGAVSLIAVSSAITLASILFVSMVKLVKKDSWNDFKTYMRDAFVNSAWKELSLGQKLKHVFGHCLRSVFTIGTTLAINALSLAGQFIMFSAFMIKLVGNAALGYAFAGINGAVHVAFGFENIQQRLDAMLDFGRKTYAKLTSPEEKVSHLQAASKKPGAISTLVGYVAATINGLGQGGLYGKQFINAATAGTVSTIAIAVALVTLLHVPVLIAGIVAGVGAFLFSALPNTNALSKTLSKDEVVPVKPSGSTARFAKRLLLQGNLLHAEAGLNQDAQFGRSPAREEADLPVSRPAIAIGDDAVSPRSPGNS